MQTKEVIRALAITVMATAWLFLVQPWLYRDTGLTPIQIEANDVGVWLNEHYYRGATVVLAMSLIAQIVWFILAVRYKGSNQSAEIMLLPWFLLLIWSLAGIGIALALIESADAFPSLVIFWGMGVGLIYWLATAMNTPTALKFVIPGSQFIRSIFK